MSAPFNPSVNDWMIRLTQLEDAISRVTRHGIARPGFVEKSLRAEIEYLKQRIESTTASSYSNGTWRI
jgi:hypothetical protein